MNTAWTGVATAATSTPSTRVQWPPAPTPFRGTCCHNTILRSGYAGLTAVVAVRNPDGHHTVWSVCSDSRHVPFHAQSVLVTR